MLLNELVTEFALDSKNPQKIFDMAREYDRLEQGAMAIGLYLRAADIEEELALNTREATHPAVSACIGMG